MMYLGFGTGPFVVGILTEKFGWRISFYLSGTLYVFFSLMLCAFFPENPTDAKFMSYKEKALFEEKHKNIQSIEAEDSRIQNKVSILGAFRRPYLYWICIYYFAQLTVQYPEFTTVPFFMNKFWGVTTEPLSYLSLGLSITAAFSVATWKIILPYLDSKISWLKCRLGFLIIPLILRSVFLAGVPLTGSLPASVPFLVMNNILLGTIFSGGIITLNYELDPFNGPFLMSIVQTFSQTSGFLVPLIREVVTRVDDSSVNYEEKYKVRWIWFFVLCGAVGL